MDTTSFRMLPHSQMDPAQKMREERGLLLFGSSGLLSINDDVIFAQRF